jgi:predicted PurR-regulated permease PerM
MPRRRKHTSGFAGIPVHEPFMVVERHPQVVTAICLSILAAIAICAALFVGRTFLLPIAAALVFSVVLAPICNIIEWFRIPRPIAALFTLIFAGAIAYAGFSLIAQPAARWVENAPSTIARAERQLARLREPLKPLQDISKEVDGLQIVPDVGPAPRSVVLQTPGFTETLLASAQTIAVQTGFVLLLAYFFLVTRREFRLKLIAFQPTLRQRVRTARVFRDMKRRVSGYIVLFSIINITVGTATGLACWQLGLPEPAMWGGIAAILNFIPFVGPTITIGLLGLAGLATFDNLLTAFLPMLAFIAISFVEANAVTPTVMGRRMTLNPLAIILSVSFWTWIWGPVGGLISLPLLIMFKVICDHMPTFSVIGALIGAPLVREKEAEAVKASKVAAVIDSATQKEIDGTLAGSPPAQGPPQAPAQPDDLSSDLTSVLGATAR